jgi:hypothetical protein
MGFCIGSGASAFMFHVFLQDQRRKKATLARSVWFNDNTQEVDE